MDSDFGEVMSAGLFFLREVCVRDDIDDKSGLRSQALNIENADLP